MYKKFAWIMNVFTRQVFFLHTNDYEDNVFVKADVVRSHLLQW